MDNEKSLLLKKNCNLNEPIDPLKRKKRNRLERCIKSLGQKYKSERERVENVSKNNTKNHFLLDC